MNEKFYVPYEKIPTKLKRYSFKSKMETCFTACQPLITPTSTICSNIIKPWQLETFALFSIFFNEWRQLEFSDNKEFHKIINGIKDKPKDVDVENILDTLSYRLIAIQGHRQQDIRHRLLRASFIFNFEDEHISMKDDFYYKFNLNYNEILEFIFPLYIIAMVKEVSQANLIKKKKKMDMNIIKLFAVDRGAFIDQQNIFIKNEINNFLYCIKYFYIYPFIIYENTTYLPLPYLLIDAKSEGMLTRITFGNDTVRNNLGYVLEKYLYKLLSDSNIYDQVIAESIYYEGKNRKKTSDVIIKKDEACVLFEVKSCIPKASLRELDEVDIGKMICRYADATVQLYKQMTSCHIHEAFNNINKENIFGVVVPLEDSNVIRTKIYNLVCEKLNLAGDDCECNYIKSNIRIVSLAVDCFYKKNLHLIDLKGVDNRC